ncbi:MAG TPA: peptidoglycan-binding domain-containing protein, partial [Bacillota bacterium]|nr:peptidoglycan-binding domain-containing protein [Bacillota bacterium]
IFHLQQCLTRLNYLNTTPTGYYGQQTFQAVKSFQRDYGLKVDGVIGDVTAKALKRAVNLLHTSTQSRWNPETLTLTWPLIDLLWGREQPARIIDVKTGNTFAVRRFGGELHCDTEPLTRRDTQILAAIYGGHWSWQRRAVIVELGPYRIAASINGYPHGQFRIKGNGFNGHFCIHFFGSLVHKTHMADPEHQRMIKKAAAYLKLAGEGNWQLRMSPDQTVKMDKPGGGY